MGKVVLIIGGARSGKSRFALNLADDSAKETYGEKLVSSLSKKLYIATLEPNDDEMKERIERHRRERSTEWKTIEEPLEIVRVIKETEYSVILLDCITLWLSNLLMKRADVIESEIERFLETIIHFKDKDNRDSALPLHASPHSLFIVSNEVGLGIVPENVLSRRFRDFSGYLNQKVAEIADEVYFVIAGIPLKVK